MKEHRLSKNKEYFQIAELLGSIASHELIVQELTRQLADQINSEHRFRIYDVRVSSANVVLTTMF